VEDVLDVVQLVEHIEELLEHCHVVARHGRGGLGHELDLVHFEVEFAEGIEQRLLGLGILGMRGEDGDLARLVLDVGDVDIGLHQRLQGGLLVVAWLILIRFF